jgi:hypothetical protein
MITENRDEKNSPALLTATRLAPHYRRMTNLLLKSQILQAANSAAPVPAAAFTRAAAMARAAAAARAQIPASRRRR